VESRDIFLTANLPLHGDNNVIQENYYAYAGNMARNDTIPDFCDWGRQAVDGRYYSSFLLSTGGDVNGVGDTIREDESTKPTALCRQLEEARKWPTVVWLSIYTKVPQS